jgi:uncharacterized RDD family membrane protein YckC
METITIHTTQNIDIDYEIGGLGERSLAALIDFALMITLVIIAAFIINALQSNKIGVGIVAVIIGIIYVFYDLFCETFFNGQSLGKKAMKIRVISLDGGRPRFSQFLLRWLFRLVDFTITGGVAAIVSAAVTAKSQRLGDLVAGTVLVRTEPRTQIDHINLVTTSADYETVFPQAAQMSDRDAALIRDVIANYLKTDNEVPVQELAHKIKTYLNVQPLPGMESMQFLQTLLKDHSHIISNADMVTG